MRTGGNYGNTLGAAKLGQRFDPLILRAETLVDVSSNASPNNNALINPSGEPWEIHEIKFGVRRETDLTYSRATGAALDVALSWLGKPVTDGFVPVWNCGPPQAVEEFRPLPATSTATLGEYWKAQDSFYSWKLDHPLYIPARQAIAVEFRNNGLVNAALRSSIALIGRVMPRSARPTKVKVPYVSAYKSRFYDFLTAGGPEVSPETTLFNQFHSPLTIERFIGRTAARVQTEEVGPDGVTRSFIYVDQISMLAFRGSLFSAKHRMTTGDIVARDWVKFGNLYGHRNYKWNVRHLLEPGVGHIVEIRKNAMPIDPSASVLNAEIINATAQAVVSVVGWREENVP